jgi:hypothetical protein
MPGAVKTLAPAASLGGHRSSGVSVRRVLGIWLTTRDPRLTRGYDLVWTALFLATAAGAAVYPWVRDRIQFTCHFKALTGIPCAGCGSTRCLSCFVRLQWGEAFLLNPLAFSFCAVSLGVVAYTAAVRLGMGRIPRVTLAATERGWWEIRGLLAGLFAANWIYLILAGV